MGLQVLLEKVELLVIEAAVEARIENREVRVLVVEAVVRLAARFLFVEGFREVRPHVMVARREVERIIEDSLGAHRFPFHNTEDFAFFG